MKKEQTEEFQEKVYNEYLKQTGYGAKFYETEVSDGIITEKL